MRDAPLDPAVRAELDALDAVLEGRARDADLELIVSEVRACRPPMAPGLELRLQSAAAAGFPRAGRRQLRRVWLASAVGGIATVALALAIALPAAQEGRPEAGGAPGASSSARGESGGVAADETAPMPQAARVAPGPRRVRRAADLTLTTPLAELSDTSDAVARTADRLGGRVQRSDVTTGESSGEARLDLRVPADRLDEALAALAELGHVAARSQRTADITARFTAVRARLADARAERAALLRALAAARTATEIESVRERLDIARGRIAAARTDLLAARRTAAQARVGVTILGVTEDEGGGAEGAGPWTPARALEDAVDVLALVAGVLIVGLAAALPLGLLALVSLPGARALRRRARERSLDPGARAV